MISIDQLHADFPILSQKVNGYSLTYLDSSNTSLTPMSVVRAMDEYYQFYNANIHRAVYPLSERATTEYESAREKIRKFINARTSKEIIFTRNATESINLVAYSWGRQNIKKADVIVLSIMEHHSNIVPWQILKKEIGCKIIYLTITEDGRLDRSQYQQVLKNEKVKLVALSHQSNVLGTINPVQELIEEAHARGAKVLIDGAQAVPHFAVDVQALDADFYVFTGHKMCGPTGIGVLFAKRDLLETMPPYLGGGDMIRTVSLQESTWNDLPYKFEAGTPNIAGAIGLGAAVDYLFNVGMDEVRHYEEELLNYALKKISAVKGVSIFGPETADHRGAIISFTLHGVHPHDAATILGERGICVRAGHHCAQPLMDFFGVPATMRMSLYFYNTKEDIDRLIEGLSHIKKLFAV